MMSMPYNGQAMAAPSVAIVLSNTPPFRNPMSAVVAVPPHYFRMSELVVNKITGKKITPEGLSVLYMSLAMAMHFFGYEFARSTAISIFTSDTIGFTSASSLSLAMACVTPFSMILLTLYNQQLETGGPRAALRNTSLLCSVSLLLSGLAVYAIEKSVTLQLIKVKLPYYNKGVKLALIPLGKVVAWVLYLFQNSYAHLLYTQHWSFIGSVLTSAQGARWFASITGVTSIASTIAAGIVSRLVAFASLPLLFALGTTASLLISLLCAEAAYDTADKFKFTPKQEVKVQTEKTSNKNERQQTSDTKPHQEGDVASKTNEKYEDNKSTPTGNRTSASNNKITPKPNLIVKATHLLQRVPALKLLCCEVISFTGLSTLMSVSLVSKMKSSMPDDNIRAAFSSSFWFYTNAVSGCMQFFVLPVLFSLVEPRKVWLITPTIIFAMTTYQSFQIDPGLYTLSSAFFLTKVVDYVLRGVISEMVYMPLDFESRYLGKEVIGVFGNRLGKSCMSLALSLITSTFGSLELQGLSRLSTGASLIWLIYAFRLGNVIPPAKVAAVPCQASESKIKKIK